MDKQAEQPANNGWIANSDGTFSPNHAAFNKELLRSALYGAGLTAGGTALYHMLHGLQSAKVPELLRDVAPAAAPARPKQKSKKNPAASRFAQTKSATSMIDKVLGSVHIIPTEFLPGVGDLPSRSTTTSINTAHAGWRNALNIAAAMAGGYGGMKAVNTFAENKKKEDLSNEVDSARKEYFAALRGKSAEALDAAFDAFTAANAAGVKHAVYTPTSVGVPKAPSLPPPPPTPDAYRKPYENTYGNLLRSDLWTAALLTALGTGSIGATYMYNQTKARSKAENLQRAQAARARLRGLQQTAWVDPEQLAALAQNK